MDYRTMREFARRNREEIEELLRDTGRSTPSGRRLAWEMQMEDYRQRVAGERIVSEILSSAGSATEEEIADLAKSKLKLSEIRERYGFITELRVRRARRSESQR
jgi:hypothetical protein